MSTWYDSQPNGYQIVSIVTHAWHEVQLCNTLLYLKMGTLIVRVSGNTYVLCCCGGISTTIGGKRGNIFPHKHFVKVADGVWFKQMSTRNFSERTLDARCCKSGGR